MLNFDSHKISLKNEEMKFQRTSSQQGGSMSLTPLPPPPGECLIPRHIFFA